MIENLAYESKEFKIKTSEELLRALDLDLKCYLKQYQGVDIEWPSWNQILVKEVGINSDYSEVIEKLKQGGCREL